MSVELDFQKKNFAIQEGMQRKITLLMNKNVTELAKIISVNSNKNTNYNKKLSQAFTQKKRELRNYLTELIKANVFDVRDLADKKDTAFVEEVKTDLL